MAGLQAGSPAGGVQEATGPCISHPWCFSPFLFPSLPLSIKINKQNLFKTSIANSVPWFLLGLTTEPRVAQQLGHLPFHHVIVSGPWASPMTPSEEKPRRFPCTCVMRGILEQGHVSAPAVGEVLDSRCWLARESLYVSPPLSAEDVEPQWG